MLTFIVACVAVSVAFAVLFIVQMLPGRSAALGQRLTELHGTGGGKRRRSYPSPAPGTE